MATLRQEEARGAGDTHQGIDQLVTTTDWSHASVHSFDRPVPAFSSHCIASHRIGCDNISCRASSRDRSIDRDWHGQAVGSSMCNQFQPKQRGTRAGGVGSSTLGPLEYLRRPCVEWGREERLALELWVRGGTSRFLVTALNYLVRTSWTCMVAVNLLALFKFILLCYC